MRETSLLFVLFVIIIASSALDTSQLVFVASEHFNKNEDASIFKSRNTRTQSHINIVASAQTKYRREAGRSDGNTFADKKTVRFQIPSNDAPSHDIGNTLIRDQRGREKKPMRKVRLFRYGTITLASKQPATLYKNGRRLLDIKDSRGEYKFTRMMKIYQGDLLAVESKRTSNRFGVAVDVRFKIKSNKGRRVRYIHYSTQSGGNTRMWRGDGVLREEWMVKKGQYCNLPIPVRVRHDRVLRPREKNAPPLNPKTRYVWVSDQKMSQGNKRTGRAVAPDTAYFLLEVGASCSPGLQYGGARPRIRRLPPRKRGEQGSRRSNRKPRRVQRKGKAHQPPLRARAASQTRTQSPRQPRRDEAHSPQRRTDARRDHRATAPRRRLDSTKPPSQRREWRNAPQQRTAPRKNSEYRNYPRQASAQPSKSRSSTNSMSSDMPKSETIEKEDMHPPQCKCRAYPKAKGSVCYHFLSHGKPYGRCKKRQCEATYQCVPGGGRGLQDCIRRVATHEIVLKQSSKGVLRCSQEELKKPKTYYTLY